MEKSSEDERRQKARREMDSFNFKGLGIEASGTGKHTALLVAIACFLGVAVYFSIQHDKNMTDALTRLEASSAQQIKVIEGVIWIISKGTDAERLQLQKPQVIREMEKRP